jgi:hypothetical protein
MLLNDRERKIARRVREKLHLSPSMTEAEVARELRGSAAWRRERMRLADEEVRDALSSQLGAAWRRGRDAVRRGLRRIWNRLRG